MKFVCFILFSVSLGTVFAQRQLVLLKKDLVISRFEEGDRIRFRRKDRDHFTSGIITGIHLDFIKLGEEDTTYLHQIKSIDMRRHSNNSFHTASGGRKLIAAGILLIVLDAVNPNQSNEITPAMLTVSSVFVAAGVFMQFVNNNYFRVGQKRKLTMMNHNPGP